MLYPFIIFGVIIKLSDSQPAVKCCPRNQTLEISQYQCVQSGEFFPKQHLLTDSSLNSLLESNQSRVPQCKADEVFISRASVEIVYEDREITRKFTQFCVDDSSDDTMLVGCVSVSDRDIVTYKKVTVRKCCPWGKQASLQVPCEPSTAAFKPNFFDVANTSISYSLNANDLDIIPSGCINRYIEEDEEVFLLKNGSVWYPSNKDQKIYNVDEFCLENTPYHETTQVFLCFKTIEKAVSMEHWISGIGIVISITFLIATFIVYAANKKKRHLYGKTLMCHIASFTLAFTCLVAAKIFPNEDNMVVHEFIAYTMYFSFIAGFFWQNVMCIDLWRTFRAIRSRDCHSRGNKVMRFLLYSAYAWGVSAILTLLVIYLGKSDLLPDEYKPTLYSSWLNRDKYGYYIFFIGPIASVIAVNIVLYIITARRCYLVKAEIGKRLKSTTSSDGKRNSRFFRKKEQLSLSAKLFVVMGMTWSLEVVSFVVQKKLQLSPYVFLISDAMNALYGLLIFIIFVIRKQMLISSARCLSSPRAWLCKRNGRGAQYHRGPTCVQQSTTDSAYSSTHVTDMESNTL